ncbi:MAG: hypothetical protein E7632_01145 [Ruminococcaceae bacterium]|nr:hypothetical protein [Oscillospiraceae bacterium]
MILTKKQLMPLFFGIIDCTETDGWLAPSRFTAEQRQTFSNSEVYTARALSTGSVGFRLRTDSPYLAFDYKLATVVHPWAFDVYVDGALYRVVQLEDSPEGHLHMDLPAGNKRVTVNFPSYAQLILKNVELDGTFRPIRRRTKVLWYGDSITQGASAKMPGGSYVNLTAEAMGWDVLNHAIGGLLYDARHILPMPYQPDKIIVALGTNGCQNADFCKRAEAFWERLHEVYPTVPTLLILPLWRQADDARAANLRNADFMRALMERYPNVRIVDGVTLIPNVPELFTDGTHPSDLGMIYYSENLTKALRRLKF